MTANNLDGISESPTLKISALANELRKKGKDVISFSLGEPDFDTPKHICDAAKSALDKGYTHYTPSQGIPELREIIAEKLKNENNIDADEKNIIVTPGAKQAVFESIFSVLNKGDDAVLFSPAWVSYEPCIKIAGGNVVWAKTDENNGFSPLNVSEYITKKTKLIILNSPCNPTGCVYSKETIKEISDIAIDKNIMVLSDEIYEKIIYDKKHISIGSINGMEHLTLTINGFSKAYAMTGWRLGYVHAPKEIYKRMIKLNSHSVSQATSFVQYAGIQALKGDQSCVSDMVAEFKARRDLIIDGLNKLDIKCNKPDGAFYVFADVSKYGTGDHVAETLLNKAYVATTPGSAFGESGKYYIRISYATSQENIKTALKRFESCLTI